MSHMLALLLVLIASSQALEGVVQPTCNLKDNCNLGDNLLAGTNSASDAGDVSADKLESKIASIFEDKVNYSLKLFADDATTTILEYQTANLSQLHAVTPGNYTIHQMEQAEDDDDQVEEDERGKSSGRSITFSRRRRRGPHRGLGHFEHSIGDFCNCNGIFDSDCIRGACVKSKSIA